jgi:deoxycytidylate deaminase
VTPSRLTWDELWSKIAADIAERSLCVRAHVGAVIVDTTNRIVSTGYNNPPSGFEHHDRPCKEWCPRANVDRTWEFDFSNANPSGPPIPELVYHDGNVYERTPNGQEMLIEDTDAYFAAHGGKQVEQLAQDYSDCYALHAEANALVAADRSTWQGGTIFVTSHVCYACAKLIANSGLKTLVVIDDLKDRSHRSPERSYDLLASCGVNMVLLTPEPR